ncbi:uncharacterized protein PRCAT00003414001 [Priceomyces carsonii]|uniref:uncharacterized protein n=1 Tax=Priceomyces carsonii TaxID=28549 RepID=UPI002EDB8C00|nr:unnamed protein product [Priceomyces carsonii]
MTAKKNKQTKISLPLDLENCEKLEHVMPPPKSRSSSITSIESNGTVESFLKPPPMRDFDDLHAFESYIRDETWDNEFDYCHAHLSYYPPFVMKEIRNNMDKIKPTMNKNSRKFRRNLQHHVKRHLMAEMAKCSGYEMDFNKIGMEESPNKITWKYEDSGLHGLPEEEEDLYGRHWKLMLEVSCNNESPLVEVDYRAMPIM